LAIGEDLRCPRGVVRALGVELLVGWWWQGMFVSPLKLSFSDFIC